MLVGKAAGVAVVLGIEKDGTDTTSSTVHAPVFEDRMAYSRSPEPAMRGGLIARNRELAHIDQLLWRARRGAGGVVALHGEPGVGKTVLVEAAVARATEFRTMQVRGNPTGEPAAVPQDWPSPLGELASRLDGFVAEELCFEPIGSTQQRVEPTRAPAAAVEAVAAALRRMAESANAPLLVTVDDCQSLPAGFIDALASAVLTHLVDEPVSLILAWRDSPHLTTFRLHRADVPQHRLSGLTLQQAVQLMTSRFETIPAEPVLSELVARTIGNPLVLADVYGRLTPEQLDGWHPLPDPLPVGEVVVEAYDVVRRLPPATRQALTVAAAARAPRDVVIAAMKQLGVDGSDLAPAVEAGIVVERGPRIDFAHPLVRAAAFRRAPADVRQAVRRALSDELAKGQAIESSAYHASIDANGPDPLATRRLGEAARVALDRGDPEAAARHEEFAARFAAESNVAQHLVAAAGHWQDAGRRDRALHCVVLAAGLPASGAVHAEILYQRARLEPDEGEASVADRMVEAAELCLADAPNRALAMLIDAAAWRVLAGELVGAEALADRTVRQAGTISSHAEVLAGAVRGAVLLAAGRPVEELAERSRVSLLIGQTERFPSSPEVALVIGHSLLRQGLWRQVDRWAHWIERCADHSGDRALAAVPLLLRASVLLVEGAFVDARRLATDGARTAERNGTVAVAAWGWNLVLQLHALTGDHQGGFRDCAKLFAASDRTGSLARLRSLPALALLELQRRRTGPAMAWARTAMADLDPWLSEEPGPLGAVAVEVAPVIASVMLLARSPAPPEQWGSLLHETAGGGAAGRGAAGLPRLAAGSQRHRPGRRAGRSLGGQCRAGRRPDRAGPGRPVLGRPVGRGRPGPGGAGPLRAGGAVGRRDRGDGHRRSGPARAATAALDRGAGGWRAGHGGATRRSGRRYTGHGHRVGDSRCSVASASASAGPPCTSRPAWPPRPSRSSPCSPASPPTSSSSCSGRTPSPAWGPGACATSCGASARPAATCWSGRATSSGSVPGRRPT